MIDIENTLFDAVATQLRTSHEGIKVYGEYVAEPASFPCVNMWESSNSVWAEGESNTSLDDYVNVTYTIQVFTNTPTKKADGKALANEIDDIMLGLRFRRTLMQQIPNIDRTIYRIELRYTGTVKRTDYGDDNTTIFNVYPR
jgi:hypothetical protein